MKTGGQKEKEHDVLRKRKKEIGEWLKNKPFFF